MEGEVNVWIYLIYAYCADSIMQKNTFIFNRKLLWCINI